MCEVGRVTVRITRMGSHAARFLATHRTAVVAAVFERCLYLEAGGAFVCLGEASIGDGPLNAVVNEVAASWVAVTKPGWSIEIREDVLQTRGWRVRFASAEHWLPRPLPRPATVDCLGQAMDCVAATAALAMPQDGLAPLVLRAAPENLATPIARVAVPGLHRLEAWLVDRFRRSLVEDAPPVGLLGLGPGLTPSGDDALCGVLLALDALGAADMRAALASAVLDAAPEATTPLSAAFLAAAAEGQGSAAFHDFIAALVAGDPEALPATIAALVGIGHTSGWDALAGAFLAIRAYLAAHPATRSP